MTKHMMMTYEELVEAVRKSLGTAPVPDAETISRLMNEAHDRVTGHAKRMEQWGREVQSVCDGFGPLGQDHVPFSQRRLYHVWVDPAEVTIQIYRGRNRAAAKGLVCTLTQIDIEDDMLIVKAVQALREDERRRAELAQQNASRSSLDVACDRIRDHVQAAARALRHDPPPMVLFGPCTVEVFAGKQAIIFPELPDREHNDSIVRAICDTIMRAQHPAFVVTKDGGAPVNLHPGAVIAAEDAPVEFTGSDTVQPRRVTKAMCDRHGGPVPFHELIRVTYPNGTVTRECRSCAAGFRDRAMEADFDTTDLLRRHAERVAALTEGGAEMKERAVAKVLNDGIALNGGIPHPEPTTVAALVNEAIDRAGRADLAPPIPGVGTPKRG